MGVADVERVIVEVEVPEGNSLEELLRGVRYRIVERATGRDEGLEELRRGVPLGVKRRVLERLERE